MKHADTHPRRNFNLFAIIALTLAVGGSGCDKLDTTPGDFQYPLSLSAVQKLSVAELTWSEATVSTFEEYLILRSVDPIPDSPEPEVTGNTIIIARIDERAVTTMLDANLPVTDTLYYKVYARIAGRLLMSPTIKFGQDLHLIPGRTDIVEHIPSKNTFVSYDRGNQQLMIYDYKAREIIRSRVFNQQNFPLLRYDPSTNEILVNENSLSQFVDYETLNVKQSINNTFSRNADYLNGWLYVTYGQFPFSFALFRRSDLSFRDDMNTLQTDWRGFTVIPDAINANKATIYDFSLTGSARYIQDNTNLTLDLHKSEALTAGAIQVAKHPMNTEFVISNTGVIVNTDLDIIKTLENGTVGFSRFTYSPDGKRLFGLAFQNSASVRVYDVENDYTFIEEYTLNNQLSPMAMFADEDHLYLVSLVFLTTSTQSLITTIDY